VIKVAGEDQFGVEWDPSLVVMHLCDNPPCFRYDHLQLGTQAENLRDAVRKGRTSRGARRPRARLTDELVLSIRQRYSEGERQVDIARDIGVSNVTIHNIVKRQTWKHLPCDAIDDLRQQAPDEEVFRRNL
jgi:hypothetical protein